MNCFIIITALILTMLILQLSHSQLRLEYIKYGIYRHMSVDPSRMNDNANVNKNLVGEVIVKVPKLRIMAQTVG